MQRSRFPVLWFFVFTYALTFVGQGVHLYVMHYLSGRVVPGTPIEESPVWAWQPYGFYITNAGPSFVALLMTLFLYGLPGVRRLAVQLAPWLVGRAWPVLVVCLFLPLLVVLVPLIILSGLGMSEPPGSWDLFTYLFTAIISGGLIGPGICEEIGWRGFALPHLQRRYSALVSSLIVGVAWAFWHWPNFVIPSDPPSLWRFAALVPMSMAASVIFTWVYNSTGGNLFAVVVLHGAVIASLNLAPDSDSAAAAQQAVIGPILYTIIAIALVWRYGAANLSWRDRVVTNPPEPVAAANVHPAPPTQKH